MMRRWFQGTFSGHYRGAPVAKHGQRPRGDGFSVEIYRAVVRDIILLADVREPQHDEPNQDASNQNASNQNASNQNAPNSAPSGDETAELTSEPPLPTHHHAPQGRCMRQPHIAHVHLVDAHGPLRTVRGAAYDVLTSELTFSHPARHNGRIYGRVEGTISGYFHPPPDAPPPTEPTAPPPGPGIVWDSVEVPSGNASLSEATPKAPSTAAAPSHTPAKRAAEETALDTTADDDAATESPQPRATSAGPPPSAQLGHAPPLPRDPPFLAGAILVAAILALTAEPYSAGIWLLCFLPPFALRKWLLGIIVDSPFIGLLCHALTFIQLLVAAMVLASFASASCKSLAPLPLILTLSTVISASVLPRRLPFSVGLLGLSAILLTYYGRMGPPFCN